jgi:hypothetical protein
MWLAFGLCSAQKLDIPLESTATFGITVYDASGLCGQVYHLRPGTLELPNFKRLKPVGTIYTNSLNIPPRNFTEGFPGVTKRFEWFAIDYTGRFWIEEPGKYSFALLSDDGSKLYIDDRTVIDNDGTHSPLVLYGTAKLSGGIHKIRVSFFQGPRTSLALMLGIGKDGAKDFKIFDTNDFLPPKNAAESKFGDPADLQNTETPKSRKKARKASK